MSKGTENDDAGVVPGVDDERASARETSTGGSSETVWPVWGSTSGRPTASARPAPARTEEEPVDEPELQDAAAEPDAAPAAEPGADEATADELTSDEPAPTDEALAAEPTPADDVTPAEDALEEATPEHATPEDATPDEATPEQAEREETPVPDDAEPAEPEQDTTADPHVEPVVAEPPTPNEEAATPDEEALTADGEALTDAEPPADAATAAAEADPTQQPSPAEEETPAEDVTPAEEASAEDAPEDVAPAEEAVAEAVADEPSDGAPGTADEAEDVAPAAEDVTEQPAGTVEPPAVETPEAPQDGPDAEGADAVEAAGDVPPLAAEHEDGSPAPAAPAAPAAHEDLDLAAATAAYAAALAAAQTPDSRRDAPTERMEPVAGSDEVDPDGPRAEPSAAAPEPDVEPADPEPVADAPATEAGDGADAQRPGDAAGPAEQPTETVPAAAAGAPTRTSVRPPAGAPRPGVPAPAEPTERIARTAGPVAGAAAATASAPTTPAPTTPAPTTPAPTTPPAGASTPAEGAPSTTAAPAARQRIDGGPVPPTPRNPSPLDDFESDDRPSRAPRVLAVLGVVVLLLVGGYVAASFAFGDKVPRGATVAGVPIGGLARDDAVARLEEDLEDASTGPVEVVAHDVQAAIDPAKAGLRFDAEATVDGLVGTDLLEPARLWRQVAGVGAVTPSTSVDEDALAAAIEELGGSLSAEPVDAGIVFVDQSASTTKAEDGWTVDADAAARALSDQWLTAARPVELPTTTVEPAITQAEADEAYDRVAKRVGSAPVSVEVEDRVAVLDPATVVANAAMVPVDGALQLQMNGEKLADEVVDQLPDLLTAAEDAHFTFEDGKPTLVEGEAGTKIDPAALATAVARAASGSDRTATVELVPTDPEDTTKAMEELGITEVVSEFKTPLTSEQRRTTNIRQGLKNLTGVLVRPGEDFSLTESLGPIDAQHGFVQAGVIVNGEHQDGIGGGLSQVSTTTFNAAFFAGFEILEHQPHSEWFQRYPEGREATMYLGSIDMRFKNDSPYGALIRGWVSGGYAHVQIWSTKHFDVATTTGPRSNVVSPRTVYSQSPTCVPQAAGNPGFRVTVNRTVTAPDGEVKEKNSWTTTYRPQNRVVCGKAPSAEKDEEKESD